MQYYLCLFHFSQSFCQFIGIFWVLVSLELSCYFLNTFVVIIFELSPFLSVFIKEDVEYFVQEGKDNSFRVALADEGIGRNWFVGHLNMANFVLMWNSISGISANTGKGFSDNELKWIFDLVPHKKADIGYLVVPMYDADLLLIVFESNHAWENNHFSLKLQNYYIEY